MSHLLRLRPGRLAGALALLASGAALPAHAALGELQAATPAGAELKAATALHSAYSVSSSTLASGTTVREYAVPGGRVFAVSWRGPMPPDLSQLLGSYYTDYQTALAAQQPGHTRRLQLDSGRMVYQTAGHMRDLRGTAYVPTLMPQGLSPGELQ